MVRPLFFVFALFLSRDGIADGSAVVRNFSGARQLKFEGLTGSVELLPSDSTILRVHLTKVDFSDLCQLSIEKAGLTVKILAADQVAKAQGKSCKANLKVEIPKGVSVETGSFAYGEIKMEGLKDRPEFKTLFAAEERQVVQGRTPEKALNGQGSGRVMLFNATDRLKD